MGFSEKIAYRQAKINFTGFPRMLEVEQNFAADCVIDIDSAVRKEIACLPLPDLNEKRIAITAGSRGIPNFMETIRAVGRELTSRGARPFVVPAMGSHGNATTEGQLEVLSSFGITDKNLDMPILASMETVYLGNSRNGVSVFCDRHAYEADYIVVCGRVKPHTDFRGTIESGLCKMMVVGLGKYDGATAFHKTGTGEMGERLVNAAEVFLSKANLLLCVALIDNAYHKTKRIEAVMPCKVLTREPELLQEARTAMARILLDEVDVLLVDYFGKEISGCGMDPNVTGRFVYEPNRYFEGFLRARKIAALRLTKASHGNAAGLGVADFISLKFAQKLDLGSIYTNCLTSRYSTGGKIPMVMNNDLDTIYAAASSCGVENVKKVRMVRVRNTLDLNRILVSENLLPIVSQRRDMRVLDKSVELRFNLEGCLTDLE